MPAVVTLERLQAICPDAIGLDAQTAAIVIEDACSLADDVIGTALSDTRLERVARYLAAHILASGPTPQAASEGVKGLNTTYQYRLGKGLASTMYGQLALQQDISGKLAAYSATLEDGGKGRPSLTWLGTPDP